MDKGLSLFRQPGVFLGDGGVHGILDGIQHLHAALVAVEQGRGEGTRSVEQLLKEKHLVLDVRGTGFLGQAADAAAADVALLAQVQHLAQQGHIVQRTVPDPVDAAPAFQQAGAQAAGALQLPQLAQAAVDVLQMAGLHTGHVGRKVAGQCLVEEVQRGFKIIAVRLLDMVVEAVDVFKMTDGFPIKAPQRAGIAQSFKSPGIERAVDPGPYGGAFRAFQLFQSFVQDTQSLRRGVGGGGQLFLDVLEGGPCLGGVGKETAQLAQGFFLMSYYAKVIADLDKPVELVEIHAAIVDIDSDFSRDFGVNWSGAGAYGKHWTGGGSAGGTSTSGIFPSAGASSAGGLSYSTLYSYGSDYFLARVTALEEDGQARVLGKPSVLTMDNVQASLENTSSYYVPVSGNESSDLFKIDSGTVLKVTPHIIPGLPGQADSIKLMVSVQDDRDDGSSLFSVDPNNLSPIKQTKINTQAIVGEGQSLLIGGHYYEIQSDAETGIPGLKNIPILGGLFGSTGKKHQRMERLILITPRIVRMDTASNVPSRVDDPRFSRTPTQADYEERRPKEMPVGGCARRRELAPDVQPAPPVTVTPQPAPVPATNKSIQNSTMPQPILTPVSTGAQPVPAPVGSTSVSAGGRQ